MTPKQRSDWERKRSKGHSHYVLVYGIIYYGGFMFLFMSLIPTFFKVPWDFSSHNYPVFSIILGLVILGLAGFCFGRLNWSITEKRYLNR